MDDAVPPVHAVKQLSMVHQPEMGRGSKRAEGRVFTAQVTAEVLCRCVVLTHTVGLNIKLSCRDTFQKGAGWRPETDGIILTVAVTGRGAGASPFVDAQQLLVAVFSEGECCANMQTGLPCSVAGGTLVTLITKCEGEVKAREGGGKNRIVWQTQPNVQYTTLRSSTNRQPGDDAPECTATLGHGAVVVGSQGVK
ncbi:hypothetical protein FDECE_13584 [Fusarium decemcellulare]|nr:hypothetical protein FDECE_13584 [Fusarium decemcellulare]